MNQLKLSELATRDPKKLTDQQILEADEACPIKFETETIRFWRLKGLLPFFEDKKHARISLAQFMWLKFLVELRKLGLSTNEMQVAHNHFIRRAYDNRLGYNSLFELERQLKATPGLTEQEQFALATVQDVIKDNLLMQSLNRDINYFNMGITEHVVYGANVVFAYYIDRIPGSKAGDIVEKPVFSVFKNGNIEQTDADRAVLEKDFDFTKQSCVLIPASQIVRETFYDCNISQEAFNIQIMEKSERELFRLIKEKKVQEIILNPLPDKTIENERYAMLEVNGELNIENIKRVKLNLGTKQYQDGEAILVDKNIFRFNSDPNDGYNL
jgi:DNA-binding transcriptional MerR regulator